MGKTPNRKKLIKALEVIREEIEKYMELKERIYFSVSEAVDENGENEGELFLKLVEETLSKVSSNPTFFKDLKQWDKLLSDLVENYDLLLDSVTGISLILGDILKRLTEELRLMAVLEEKPEFSKAEILIAKEGIDTLKEVSQLIGDYAKEIEEALKEVEKRLGEEEK
ncbi:MAG: hypothetical protein DSZ31_04245 [Gammaproteobacteria bacterium]|nr:MAG: hypothetical protein DSZ31_04245 [Gammaproteobacteria bacterium]